jgi:hypothetical protein
VTGLVVVVTVPLASLLAHEYGHVLAHRLVTGRGGAVVERSWVRIHVLLPSPAPAGRGRCAVAAAGPLAGIAASSTGLVAGHAGIAWLCAIAHAASLTPFASDGRHLVGGALEWRRIRAARRRRGSRRLRG